MQVDSDSLLSDSAIFTKIKEAEDTDTKEPVELYKPLYIHIQKSQPEYVYPLRYIKDFSYRAWESVIDSSFSGCKADLADFKPTCGWQFDEQGQKITHS